MRWTLVLVILLAGCSTMTWARMESANRGNPRFARDAYDCKRENTHTALVTGVSASARETDYDMAVECLAVRGWR